MVDKLTERQAAIITAFTGILVGNFRDFHKYAEELMERPVFTHEFGSNGVLDEIKEKSKRDFILIQPEGSNIKSLTYRFW